MEALVLRRAETLEELHELFFPGLSRKRAVNRLAQLKAAGYLRGVEVEIPGYDGAQRVYTLGPKGKPALELRSLMNEHFRHRRWNPMLRDSSVPHQVVVNRVADWMGAHLIPEHLLPAAADREAARHKPDGVFETADKDDRGRRLVAVEVDLGHYSRTRLLGKVATFLKDPEARAVIVVVPDYRRMLRVLDWLRHDGHGPSPGHWTQIDVVELADVNRGREQATEFTGVSDLFSTLIPADEPPYSVAPTGAITPRPRR